MENEELILPGKIAHGDSRAMKILYDKYAGYMSSVCSRYISDEETIRDILQDSFVDIFTTISKFEYRGEGSLKGWMTRIVVNKSIDNIKKSARFNNIQSLWDLPDVPDETDVDMEDVPFQIIYDMIREMPVGYRTVFNLFVFEHRSHKEIAQQLGIKESSSASQYHRAKAMLCENISRYKSQIQKGI